MCLDHSGAVYQFGLPDSDYVWTLEDSVANEKRAKPAKDRKPVSCPACGAVFVGKPACPECGKVLPKKKRKSLIGDSVNEDGVLTEFSGKQESFIAVDTLERLWKKLLYIGRAKGWEMRRVAGVFRSETKCAPWEAGMSVPMPSGRDGWSTPVREWMEQIR